MRKIQLFETRSTTPFVCLERVVSAQHINSNGKGIKLRPISPWTLALLFSTNPFLA